MKSFKQYLSESDPYSWTLPGYSYDGQDPNLRSDEDAEKTKEWYKDVGDRGNNATYTYRGDTVFLSSEVDASGRPTGVKTSRESDETRARREEQEAADEAAEMDEILARQREDAIKRQQNQEKERRDREEATRQGTTLEYYHKMKQRDQQRKEKEQELRRRRGIPMDELA
jgi:hypothetical protein